MELQPTNSIRSMAGLTDSPQLMRSQSGAFADKLKAQIDQASKQPASPDVKIIDKVAQEKQVRELVQKLLGQAFFGPIVKQMRNGPWKDKLMSGGRGGDAFQSMMDQRMVEQLGHSIGGPLVRAMTERMLGRSSDRDPARGLQIPPKPNNHSPNLESSNVQLDRRA